MSDGKENDMIKGRKFNFPKGSIVAFDKGYVDYGWYGSLTKQGVSFVTRIRPKAVYSILRDAPVNPDSQVIYDQIIQLDSEHAIKQVRPSCV